MINFVDRFEDCANSEFEEAIEALNKGDEWLFKRACMDAFADINKACLNANLLKEAPDKVNSFYDMSAWLSKYIREKF